MRIIGLICSIMFLCPQVSGAQERFFNFLEGWVNNSSIELEDSYLLFGLGLTGGPFNHEFLYNELNNTGMVIHNVTYFVDTVETTSTRLGSQMMAEFSEETLFVVGQMANLSTGKSNGALFEYDYGDELFSLIQTCTDDWYSHYNCILIRNDTSLLISGFLDDSTGFFERTRLYEMDMDGNIRWQRTFYGGSLTDTRPQQIEVMSNGNIALLLNEYDADYLPFHEHEQAIVVMMDSVGNELWRVSPGDTANYRIWPGGMVELPNGELLISYTDPFYYDEEGEWHFSDSNTVHLASYSLSGDLNWEVSYLTEITNGLDDIGRVLYRVRQMQPLADGNILITGTTGYGGLMLKVEPDGDLLWFREHLQHPIGENEVTSEHTHIYHTLPTSDGGFLSTGQYRSDPGNIYPGGIQTAIALKVDEYGCLEEGCGPTDAVAELPTEEGLQVYPNPGKGLFTIQPPKSPEGGLGNRTGHLEVLDIHGRTVHSRSQLAANSSQLTIDLTAQPSGLYLVRLLTEKEVFTVKIIKE